MYQTLVRENKKKVSQNEGKCIAEDSTWSLRVKAKWTLAMCIHIRGLSLQSTAAANTTENPETSHYWKLYVDRLHFMDNKRHSKKFNSW